MTTFARGASSVTPVTVTGYASTRAGGNIVHSIIGNSAPDITLRAAGLRTGTLELLFANLAEARTAEALFAARGIVTMADADLPALNMSFVLAGNLTCKLDPDTRSLWLVSVDFQEVV